MSRPGGCPTRDRRLCQHRTTRSHDPPGRPWCHHPVEVVRHVAGCNDVAARHGPASNREPAAGVLLSMTAVSRSEEGGGLRDHEPDDADRGEDDHGYGNARSGEGAGDVRGPAAASGRTTARSCGHLDTSRTSSPAPARSPERHHQTAALRTAEAANATGDERAQLERQAVEAAALAAMLDARGRARDRRSGPLPLAPAHHGHPRRRRSRAGRALRCDTALGTHRCSAPRRAGTDAAHLLQAGDWRDLLHRRACSSQCNSRRVDSALLHSWMTRATSPSV